MNKIYRRLWSTARQCWVVASELTFTRGKRAQTVRCGAALAAALAASPLTAGAVEGAVSEDELEWWERQTLSAFQPRTVAPASAGTNAVHRLDVYNNTSASGWSLVTAAETMAVGAEAQAGGVESIAVGIRSKAAGPNSVAVGNRAETYGSHAVAVGFGSRAHSVGSVSLGNASRAEGHNSMALGSGAYALGSGAIAVGGDTKARAEGAIVLGDFAEVANGSSRHSIAIGNRASAGGYADSIALGRSARAHGTGKAMALGAEANASHANSVALGANSATSAANQISVGNSTLQRKIVNLADGAVTTSSTEAVNGRQLNSVKSRADSAFNTAENARATANTALTRADQAIANSRLVTQTSPSSAIRVGIDNTGTIVDVSNRNGTARRIQNVASGAVSAGSTDAVTGQQLYATNQSVSTATSTANAAKASADAAIGRIGAAAVALGQAAVAEGSGSTASAALGSAAKAYNGSGVAMGADARAGVNDKGDKSTASGAVAIGALSRSGNGAVATGLRASAIGDRAVALGNDANAAATHATATGYKATASASQATAIGREASASGTFSTALGNLASARAESAVALGDRAIAAHTGSVALGNGSQTTAGNQISVGSGTLKRKIVNVADGALNTSSAEAVTGKQLNATNVEVASVRTTATSAQITANAAKTTADNALAKADVLGGLVSQVSATGNVRLGGENTGTVLDVRNKSNANRKLTGVADAALNTSSTEAVTGRQLFGVDQKVTANQSLLASHATQLAGHEARIADNRRDLDDLRTEFDNFDPDLEGVVRYAADGSVDMDGGKVRGVAAGDISSAGSTDAVNGGQLFATNQRVEAIDHQRRFFQIGTDSLSEDADAGWFGVAIGESAEASPAPGKEGGTAVGSFSKAMGTNSVALGRAAHVLVNATEGFALGPSSRVEIEGGVALGAHAQVKATATNGVALGYGSYADQANTVSVGSESVKRRIVNVGRGLGSGDASTVEQLHEALGTLGGGAGMDASGNVVAPTYRMQGATQNNVADALAVLDGAVITAGSRVDQVENQLRSVFQDSPATRSDGLSQLNLAGANGMVLGNVANGLIAPGSRDAVNGGQLYAAEQKIERNRNDLDELRRGPSGAAAFSEAEISGSVDFGGARLVGVAEGRLEESSTDVVNGSQLFATNRRLNAVEDASRYVAVGEGIASDVAESSWFGVAVGAGAIASPGSEGGTAIGSYTSALSINSVAVGRGALVTKDAQLGIAIGGASESDQRFGVALGPYAKVRSGALNSVALGSYSEALEQNVLSVGNLTLKRRIVNVANGRNANDAATVGQLRGALATLGSDVDANGNIVGPTFNVQGGSQHTLGDALNALDGAVITAGSRVDQVENQLRSVFQDSPATRSDGLGQLNLAGANGMVLGNVANGLIAPGSRDAVNGGQLHAMEQRLDGRIDGLEQRVDATPEGRALASASAPTPPAAPEAEGPAGASGDPAAASAGRAGGGIASADGGGTPAPAEAPAPTPQVNTADLEKMLARANEYTDGAISNFERRLDKMDKRFNRMAAMSSAQTAMAMNTAGLATYNRLGAGVGYAEGESAMAVGYQRVLNDKGSATFSLNGAFTNSGERSMGVGVGIGW
ncbi:ESPR-type extended signal peptide-containing protein [Stenotrophomonas indicatrix]|uniref:ESPR-type extended signal peptide-containing protein n=1 Tax=Stenotrophomonas indicatrix TaxID=2045451 RepID=UPI001CBAAAE6|nr:ESPR-type extended signal peptide-containing protein [Stenotrophomonas indicatrix]